MSLHLKWFLALSLTAHAAAVFTWVMPLPDAGQPGQVILLHITQRAGQTASVAVAETALKPRQPAATEKQQPYTSKPVTRVSRATGKQAVETNAVPQNTRQAQLAAINNAQPGQATTLAASSPRPSVDESDRHLRDSVLQLVTQRLDYPAIARRKGWQGVVTLELHIEPDGYISDLQVNKTSGYPALDRAAMKSLLLASIPGAGQWLHGRSIDMLVPVEYRLLDS